jgi:NifU-like protein involved in Fe-S cluster formation
MTIQEAQHFFETCDFSEASKAKILELLNGKTALDLATITQIKAVMQEELDADFKEAGIDEDNDPVLKDIRGQYAKKLEEIDLELQEDMAFVETELAELDKARKEVMQISDEMEADAIKQTI